MDAKRDAKLKFLPRHLQKGQPAANKSKRRVTVEDENVADEDSDRKSVFDRLGPGSQGREKQKQCFEFLETGKCAYGKNCQYSHVKAGNKTDGNKSPDLRLRFKGQAGAKDKDTKLRSQVFVRKPGAGSDEDSEEGSDGWSADKLESKKEFLELEQKRKEIQQALNALEGGSDDGSGDGKNSDSNSSPDRGNKKKKDKNKKRDKKKNKKGIDGADGSEKVKDGKRKHDSDDDKSSPHKKRKKKKKGQEIVQASDSKTSDLYNPESPTPTKDDGKRTSSLSPSPKNKGKKKKKKGGKDIHEVNKGKKLLSPLFKVLKKKGSESISSKRSRSASRDSAPVRKRSRSPSSSSSSSSSPSPSRKRKSRAASSKDRARKKVKSNEKKKSTQRSRDDSSSSDSSSSSQQSTRGRGKKPRDQSASGSKGRKDRSSSVSRGQRGNQDRKKQDARTSDSRRRSEDRGRPNERQGRRGDRVSPGVARRNASNSMKGGSRDRDSSRNNARRDMKNVSKGDSSRPSEREREKERDRDSSRGGGKDARKDAGVQRDRNEKERMPGDRDRGRDRSSGRERGQDRDREKESNRIEPSKDDSRGNRNDRNKEIGRGNRERDSSRNERERDGGRNERESVRNEREVGRNDKDTLRREREPARGEREHMRGEPVRGDRDLGRGEPEAMRGDREPVRGDREMSRGEREMLRGDRDIPRGEREMLRGEREMLGVEREMQRGEREMPRGERDMLRGERELSRGEREMPRNEREMLRGDRDILRGERDMRGERGRDDMRRGESVRRGGSLDRDLMRDFDMHPHRNDFGMNRGPGGGRFGDQMPFEEPGPMMAGDQGPMHRPFHEDRQRGFGRGGGPDFDRGDGRGFDRMDRGRPGFHGMGPGRDRMGWDGRRDNRGRGGGGFGEFRGDDRPRDYGGMRDDRRGGGHEDRLLPFPPGGRGGGDREMERGRFPDKEQMLPPQDDFRGREDNWKRREGSRDSNDRDSGRNRRVDDVDNSNNASRERGPPDNIREKRGERNQGGKESANQGSRFNNGNKNQSMKPKEESPSLGKDEHSLANLFSQTETIGKKKPVVKSFGGKKSPRGPDEAKKPVEKSKPPVKNQQTNARGNNNKSERKVPPLKSGQNDKNGDKQEDKDDTFKNKTSRSLSPKGSQKSSDSVRSGKKRSRSPDGKTFSDSPVPNQGSRRGSLSPTHLSTKEKDTENKPAVVSFLPRNEDLIDTENNDKSARSRSQSLSEPETPVAKTPTVDHRRKSSDNESQHETTKDEEGDIAFAMGGDTADDEQVFSDWSEDDDADNILDQPEDYDNPYFEIDPRHHRPSPVTSRFQDQRRNRSVGFEPDGLGDLLSERNAVEQNIPGVKILEDKQIEKPAREQRRRNDDDENYEDISSDENDLDEEGERLNKRTIVSILDIDMSALVDQAKPRAAPGPVFQRFKASSVFASMGISRAFAGERLFAEVQQVCQDELQAMAESERRADDSAKETEDSADDNNSSNQPKVEAKKESETPLVKIKIEPGLEIIDDDDSLTQNDDLNTLSDQPNINENTTTPQPTNPLTSVLKPEFKLYGNTSSLHKHFKSKFNQKPALLNNVGLFRRALTARKDLDIRRQLCNIDPKFDQGAVYPSGNTEPDIARHCLQIFRQRKPVGLTVMQSVKSVSEERQS